MAVAVIADAVAGNRADRNRTAELLAPGREGECVQLDDVLSRVLILNLGNHVQRMVLKADHRRPRDADFGHQEGTSDVDQCVDGGNSAGRIDEALLPERRGNEAVSIEGINAVVLARYVDPVMRPLAGER